MPTTHQGMFVNLPVADLPRSIQFFTALGYAFNPQFTNENATCMLIGENMCVMLLAKPFFAGFVTRPIADTHAAVGGLVALSCASREEVDTIVAKAKAAGAQIPKPPVDHGFMYQHGFTDLDGHVWEVFWMDANGPK